MKIKEITISLSQEEAISLKSTLSAFFEYQAECGIGEESKRTVLAQELIDLLPKDNSLAIPNMYITK